MASAVFFKSIPFTDPHKYKGSGVLSPFLAEVRAGIWNYDEIHHKKQTPERKDAEIGVFNIPSHKDKCVLRNAAVQTGLFTKKKVFKREKNGFVWHSIGYEFRGPTRRF